jgi:hypothetical protein
LEFKGKIESIREKGKNLAMPIAEPGLQQLNVIKYEFPAAVD